MLSQVSLQTVSSKPTPGRDVRAEPPVAAHSLTGSIELMGAPMSFARNAEIYGEHEPADYL